MRALVIAHEPDGGAGQVEARLVERGVQVDTHYVVPDPAAPNLARPWPEVDEYDLVLPMGSVRSLTNKTEIDSWIHNELDLLRRVHEQGTAILGICFGGQLIAEALGGSVEVAPVTEIGWYEIEAPPGAENPVGAGPWKEWHHDRITPPPGAEVLARNANAVQLFRVDRTVGTQFHPEVDVAHISQWLSNCPQEYLNEAGADRHKILADMREHEERNTEQCHALVDWFLDDVAFPDHADAPV